jgi:hypothetical protein
MGAAKERKKEKKDRFVAAGAKRDVRREGIYTREL